MLHINRVELKGIVGNVRIQQSETNKIVRLSVATNYSYKDKNGEAVVETTWHNVVWYPTTDKTIPSRSDAVRLTGRIRQVRYTETDGTSRPLAEVVADNVEII